MSFALKMRNWLRENDLSSSAAGRFLGVAGRTVVAWREGMSMPDLRGMKHLCERIGVSMDVMMDYTPDAPEVIADNLQRCRGLSQRFETISHNVKVKVVESVHSDRIVARRHKLTTRQVKRIRREYLKTGKL